MKTKAEARAELLEALGIDVILKAHYEYCMSGKNCNDCHYLNDSDGTCQVFNYLEKFEELPDPDHLPYGDNGVEEDPRANRRAWEVYG